MTSSSIFDSFKKKVFYFSPSYFDLRCLDFSFNPKLELKSLLILITKKTLTFCSLNIIIDFVIDDVFLSMFFMLLFINNLACMSYYFSLSYKDHSAISKNSKNLIFKSLH